MRLRLSVLLIALGLLAAAPRAEQCNLLLLGVGTCGAAAPPAGITLSAHSIKSLGTDGGISNPVNSTGAAGGVMIIAVAGDATGDVLVGDISDSESLTWSQCDAAEAPSNSRLAIFSAPLTATDATHTVTVTRTGSFSAIGVATFTGTNQSPCDDSDSGLASGTEVSPTTGITPSANDALVITAAAVDVVATWTEPSGYTLIDQINLIPGTSYGLGWAYVVQGAATATDPEWTASTNGNLVTIVASYVP